MTKETQDAQAGSGVSEPKGGGDDRTARMIGVGCFTAFTGFWSGGMVAVLIGKIVAGLQKSPSCEGLPLCNWHVYAIVGCVVGAVTLPALAIWRLRQRAAATESSERG